MSQNTTPPIENSPEKLKESPNKDEKEITIQLRELKQLRRMDSVEKSRATLKKILRKLLCTFVIRVFVFLGELIGGILAGSLAIIADSLEKFSDMVYLSVSIFSVWVSVKNPTSKFSFGFYRAGVIGALFSTIVMWIIAGTIVYSAINRIIELDTLEVEGDIMCITSIAGLVINVIVMLILQKQGDPERDLEKVEDKIKNHTESPDSSPRKDEQKGKEPKNENLRTVIFDILGDMVQSIITIIASILIWVNPEKFKIADPIASLSFPIIAFFVTRPIIKECIRTLMEAAPNDMDVEKIKGSINDVEGVINVEDIHIWSIAAGKFSLSAHVVCKHHSNELLHKIVSTLQDQGIGHPTIQIEVEDEGEIRELLKHKH